MTTRSTRRLITSLIALATAGISATAATAAASSADADATVHIGSLYEPQNLSNAAGGGQGITEVFNGNVYEGLFKLTDSGEVEPLLASEHTVSEDGLTYTFTLREGVTFHSGKALTADDVVASLALVTAEESLSARKSAFEVVDTVEATDERTVTITLTEPSISFIYNLSYIWVVNSENADLETAPDGTGPYRFEDWTRGSSITLVRNDGYRGEPASNAEVVFHYYTDASAESNALLAGEIDIITSIQSPDALAQFEGNDDFTVSAGDSTTKELLAFNDRVEPFNDPLVRRAVYSAIDREKLLDAIWGGYGTLIGSMVPPSDPWYEDLTGVNPYDVELAQQLLGEAGLGDGFEFTLDTPSYDPHPIVAEFIQSELAKVGITVNINIITADEWYTKVFQEQDFEATLQEHVNDRDVVWYGNPDFYWGYDNPQVSEWVEQSEQAATEEQQTELLLQVNRQIAEDAASVWLYLYPQIVVSASNVTGYPVNGLNSQFFAYDIAVS